MYQRKPDFEADLTEARDPNTSAKRLGELLLKHHGEQEIAKAVAQNPACDMRSFAGFWKFLPEVAEANPAFETNRSDPNWEQLVRRAPNPRYHRYSSQISMSTPQIYRLLWVMEHGNSAYQREMMSLEAIPEYVIRDHVGSRNAALRKTIAMRKTAPEDVYEQLARDRAKRKCNTSASSGNILT